MSEQRKLGRATDQRMAMLKNQVTALLWNGKIETTFDRAKEVSRLCDKIVTLAVNSYEDTYKKIETKKNTKGQEIQVEMVNDGAKKLSARRSIMTKVYHVDEQRKVKEPIATYRARVKNIKHPLIEKIFNEIAPKYAIRAKELGQAGGYTRVLKAGFRRGDAAEMAIIELV